MTSKYVRYTKAADKNIEIMESENGHKYSDEDKIRLLLSASRMVPSKLPWQQILGWHREHKTVSSTGH